MLITDNLLWAGVNLEEIQAAGTIDEWTTISIPECRPKTLLLESLGLESQSLRPGEVIVVGRSEHAQCSFPQDSSMSRHHFVIEFSENGPVLRDLMSSNGTFVNSQLTSEKLLCDADRITAGRTLFVVRFVDE